jgi:integrase
MASIARDSNGRKRIEFFNQHGERKTIRLGKATMKQAETVKRRIELLVADKINGSVPDPDMSHWLASIGDDLHAKLAKHGLIAPRHKVVVPTLAPFLESYIAGRTDLKRRTVIKFGATRDYLVEFLGAYRLLGKITAGDADDWRVYLISKGMSENTVRKHVQIAKQFFKSALRRKLIDANPFADLKSTVRANPEKSYFVTSKEADAIFAACPDSQWRLIFALSRYGGLRCPSEHLELKWSDIDWERGRITVRSPKTEHHEGKASRVVPLFPELRPYLEAVRDEVNPGIEVRFSSPVIRRYRNSNANLRTQLRRIIERAGLRPWPKLFQNLRATRETELAEQFPIHVVCEWIGNSEAVARKHYLQVTDDHFAAAVGSASYDATQNATQNTTQPVGIDRQASEQNCEISDEIDDTRELVASQIAEEGLEPPTRGL